MSVNSILYAGIITLVTLLISYPTALFLTRLKAQAVVAYAHYFANLGKLIAKSLCLYGNLWSTRRD